MTRIRDGVEAADADGARRDAAAALRAGRPEHADDRRRRRRHATPRSWPRRRSSIARYALRRVYYSAFSPIPGADPSLPPAAPPLVREHRLYQADWLMRFYGFDADELTTAAAPDLDLETDPKLAWALRHPELLPGRRQPRPRERLLRVPGLGRRTVHAAARDAPASSRHPRRPAHARRAAEEGARRSSSPPIRRPRRAPSIASTSPTRVRAPRQLQPLRRRRDARAPESSDDGRRRARLRGLARHARAGCSPPASHAGRRHLGWRPTAARTCCRSTTRRTTCRQTPARRSRAGAASSPRRAAGGRCIATTRKWALLYRAAVAADARGSPPARLRRRRRRPRASR